jgi:predicted SprT family Zn-dependent metalloprotease
VAEVVRSFVVDQDGRWVEEQMMIPEMESALYFLRRRVFLAKRAPNCPRCGSCQIQLRRWTLPYRAPAWRCRDCRLVFVFEPIVDMR